MRGWQNNDRCHPARWRELNANERGTGLSQSKLKPCWEWAGGKRNLLPVLDEHISVAVSAYPETNVYAEPFVGGGALFWHVLNKYADYFDRFVISDINAALINTYKTIRDSPDKLIQMLSAMSMEYLPSDNDMRKRMYYERRDEYNSIVMRHATYDGNDDLSVTCASLFLFLNKTCFNGLYRTARDGHFNTPAGRYKNPLICDDDAIINASMALSENDVTIKTSSYADMMGEYVSGHTFVYLDLPYRPLTRTSAFTGYDKSGFNDDDQRVLASFCDGLTGNGMRFMLSNSDPHVTDTSDDFFDDLYKDHKIERVSASRNISSKADGRKQISEILVTNF